MIGAGGVATVAAFKIAQNTDVFTDFMIASRRKEKCDKIVEDIHKAGLTMNISTAQVDADDVEQLKALFNDYRPELVINLALPYQDLTIMDACLACGCHYLDTANYEPKDEAHFEYSWQWAYKERFEQAGLTAILGCGFDPGVSGIYTAYAAKHHFDEMHTLDIVDCNAGNHHKAFATNFNPEINIREITQKGLYYKDGEWLETEPLSVHKPLTYPNIGPRESYLMHHEELESLVKNYPTIRQARFWMTFGQQYLTYLDVIRSPSGRRFGKDGTRENSPATVPKGRAAQSAGPRRELRRRDEHRLPHTWCEGRQGTYILRIQQLQASGCLQRDGHAGRELHHGRAGNDWRNDVLQRPVEQAGRVERGGVRPGSVHGATQQAGAAVARGIRRRPRAVIPRRRIAYNIII